MEIHVDKIEGIKEISATEFNVTQVNRIKKEYGSLRQESKAPT